MAAKKRLKRASPARERGEVEHFELDPKSDEARLPQRGAFLPERPRDGTAEASDLHELAQRAVESHEDPEAPLNFDPPSEGPAPERHRGYEEEAEFDEEGLERGRD
jgi:hypothetical protein